MVIGWDWCLVIRTERGWVILSGNTGCRRVGADFRVLFLLSIDMALFYW